MSQLIDRFKGRLMTAAIVALMLFAGRPISAAIQILLLGVGQRAVGAAGPDTWTVPIMASTSNPVQNTVSYFGGLPQGMSTSPAIVRVYFQKAGTIKEVTFTSYAVTAGTGEAWASSLRLNNTTDTSIASVALASNIRVWSNALLGVAVVAGDYVEIKVTNPVTWSVAPIGVTMGGYIRLES